MKINNLNVIQVKNNIFSRAAVTFVWLEGLTENNDGMGSKKTGNHSLRK